MRDRIASLVQRAEPGDKLSKAYDIFIMAVAMLSIVPLMFKESNQFFETLDLVTVYILFFDYIMRWIASDHISKKKGLWPFILYPITPFAILDLVSILPSLGLLGHGFRILRMLRIFKVVHYSKSFLHISNVFRKEKHTLLSVLLIAIAYIFVSALAMFSYEPETFETFFNALYWATTALTTVGYGDIYPKSQIGQLISMVSSLFGIAVIALPAGIVTGGFVEELSKDKKKAKDEEKEESHE